MTSPGNRAMAGAMSARGAVEVSGHRRQYSSPSGRVAMTSVFQPPYERPTILLVDDDPAMVRLLAKWLELDGYRVRRAANGREAMESILADPPNFLLTDWEMPDIDGLALCRWLRRQNLPEYIYTVFLTIRCGMDDMVAGLEAGADDFIKKPVDRPELLARIHAGRRVLDLQRRLCEASRLDPLTRLLTQPAFYRELESHWGRVERSDAALACAMVDIDFFKQVNDTHGHTVGDVVIGRVAQLLRDNQRSGDVVCRYGGEEFCVLLADTDERGAQHWAERLRQVVADEPFDNDGRPLPVTVSIGVAQRQAATIVPHDLVDLADQALLVAKRAGRNRVVGFQCWRASGEAASRAAEAIFEGVTARDVMTPAVVTLSPGDALADAVERLLETRSCSASVVDRTGRLVGTLSDKDILARLLLPNWAEHAVGEAMSMSAVSFEEAAPLLAVYEFLGRVSLRSVAITRAGRPVGMIHRSGLMRWFLSALQTARPSAADAFDSRAAECDFPGDAQRRIALRLSACSGELADELATGSESSDWAYHASQVQALAAELLAAVHSDEDWRPTQATVPATCAMERVATPLSLAGR